MLPHQIHESLRNGQTQAAATKASGGGTVTLRKDLEEFRLCSAVNADAGVVNFKVQRGGLVVQRFDAHREIYLAVFRELDGVAGEVEQHLLQTHRIAQDI